VSETTDILVKLCESFRAFTYNGIKHFTNANQVEVWRPEMSQRLSWSTKVPFLGIESSRGVPEHLSSYDSVKMTFQLYYIEAWNTTHPGLHQIDVVDALADYLKITVAEDIGEVTEIESWLYPAESVVFQDMLGVLSQDYCAALITFNVKSIINKNS
jgi:hypothetical protein